MTIAEHWVASTRGRQRCLLDPDKAGWLWARLRRAIPEAWSCVLMPDHLHLVAPPTGGGGPDIGTRLRRVLTGFTVRFGVKFEVLPPEVAHSREIAGRMIRYGFYNAVRAELADDPWCWTWSTLRDLGGATFPIWTHLSTVARGLGLAPATTLRRLTTTADLAPPPPVTGPVAVASVAAIRAAVAAVLRIPFASAGTDRTSRALVVQAAAAIGSTDARTLAIALRCGERTVYRDRTATHPALPAVLRCLSNPRLCPPIPMRRAS